MHFVSNTYWFRNVTVEHVSSMIVQIDSDDNLKILN